MSTAKGAIASFTNSEVGVESYVIENCFGFAVFVRDTDADEVLGCSRVFPVRADAEHYAHKCAG